MTDGSGSRYADAMARRDLIAERLTKAFAPVRLDVVDESHQHAGHAGHREGGETHFRVYIVAEVFRGKSRLERHRMINATLVGELERQLLWFEVTRHPTAEWLVRPGGKWLPARVFA